MYIPRLDSSCEYYFIGEMIYHWIAPKDINEDSVFRLRLTTDVPSTTHLSGKLRLSHADATSSSAMRVEHSEVAGLSMVNVAGVALVATLSLLLACWVTLRLRRRSQKVVLE
jgi:hypothetical protein